MEIIGEILFCMLLAALAFAAGDYVGSTYKIDSDEKLIRDMMRLIEDQKKLIDEMNAELETKQHGDD